MQHVRTASAVGLWLTIGVAAALVSGLARLPWSWVLLGVVFLLVPSQLAWHLTSRGRRVAPVVALALLAGAAAQLVVVAVTPLAPSELRRVAAAFVLPDAWSLVDDDVSGQPLCLERCPTVERTWTSADRASVAAVEAVAILRSEGFRVEVSEEAGTAVILATSGRVEVRARVTPRGAEASEIRFTLTSRRS